MNISAAQIEEGLNVLAGIDFSKALSIVQSRDVDGEIQLAEDILPLLAGLIPGVDDIKIALMVLAFIYDGYRSGLIKSASPDDPAMQRVTGPHQPGMSGG